MWIDICTQAGSGVYIGRCACVCAPHMYACRHQCLYKHGVRNNRSNKPPGQGQ